MQGKIIDFHTHVFPEKVAEKAVEQLSNYYNIPVPYQGELQELLNFAQEAGVGKVVLHAVATKPTQVQVNNDWISGVISDRVIGFGSIHPDYPKVHEELDRMAQLGLTGIKFHSDFQGVDLDDPRMWAIYEAIGDRFPVLFHVGDVSSQASAPHKLAKVLDAFPHMTVIAAHLGGYVSWQEALQFLIGRNLYLDTSSALWVLSPKEATEIIRTHGVHRVLFGSDYPVCTPKEDLERVDKLDLTLEEKEMLLWKNAQELLNRFAK